MGVGMAGAGMGMQLGGQLMSGIGEYQGLSAMADESGRQVNEAEAAQKQQQALMAGEIERRQLALASDSSSPFLTAQRGALAGAGAMSKQLGLNSADRAKVQSAMLPQQVLAAQGMGQNQMAQQNAAGMGIMGSNIQQSQRDQRDRASLYGMMMGRAAEHGAGFRQFGEGMQQGGMAMFGTGLGQAERKAPTSGKVAPKKATSGTIAPKKATYGNTGQSIFPMK